METEEIVTKDETIEEKPVEEEKIEEPAPQAEEEKMEVDEEKEKVAEEEEKEKEEEKKEPEAPEMKPELIEPKPEEEKPVETPVEEPPKDKEPEKKEKEEPLKEKKNESLQNLLKDTKAHDVVLEPKPKPSDLDKEMDVSKQAAELKAMFPDLEVIQPLSRLSQIDTFVLRDQKGSGALDFSETTVAQLFNNAVKWPKEYAIQVRLQHICHTVEYNEWPVSKTFTAYSGGIGHEYDLSIHETPSGTPKRDSSTPMSMSESEVITITTDHCIPRLNANKKRKRHIAIDVETERAKLHALLNSAHTGLPNPLTKPGTSWDNDDSEDSRRSTPITQNVLQPPPAHQNSGGPRVLSMPFDLKYHMPPKQIGTSTLIPGTSSTLTPIDLSSGLPKMNTPDIPKVTNQDIQNEVQDFSMPSKKLNTTITASGSSKGKLDDMLNKLKKKNNCPVEEPVVGKEKKRKKLDEIVLGLSAAKEQNLFPETSKKPQVTPSVTVTPTSAPITSAHTPPQKPFTITVTSVPSPAPSTSKNSGISPIAPPLSSSAAKDSFSTFLAQAEQQNLLLKKQQQQRKSYEAMIADINKVADFSSKVNSYSHEAKVNKWLAEQNSMVPDQLSSADYLSRRSRNRPVSQSRPSVDPSLLDWKKLTGMRT